MEVLQYRVLGPLDVLRAGEPVPLAGRTVLALLAALLLRPNEVVPPETMADQVWGPKLPRHPRAALQNAMSRVRMVTGETAIETLTWGYRLRADASHHDLLRFQHLAQTAEDAMAKNRPERALKHLDEAVALWRSPLLGNIASSPLALDEVPRLTELYLAAVEKRAVLLLRLGRPGALAAELAGLARQNPLREPLTAYLMIALGRAGRRSDALAAYHALRRTLGHELGIDPSSVVQELYVQILGSERALSIPRAINPWRSG